MMTSFPDGGCAVVFGATGGIGSAVVEKLKQEPAFADVRGFSRSTSPRLDLEDESSIAAIADELRQSALPIRLVFVATGILHGDGMMPEKKLSELETAQFQRQFTINTLGPALIMKHMLPLLPREGKSVFAALSAKVGSLSDNGLGGWHSYRASKAALNMYIRNAAIELQRNRKEAICLALHPGTVDSALSEPFAKFGLNVRPPAEAAHDLVQVLDQAKVNETGRLVDYRGDVIPY